MSAPRRVLVTGPESSGTTYVANLLGASGLYVLHRSQPNGTDWIDVLAMLDEPGSGPDAPHPPMDRAIVVVRGARAHTSSQVGRNIEGYSAHALARRRAALARLGPALGDPRVLTVTYESLIWVAEREFIFQWLGVPPGDAIETVEYHDQNWKHYP